MAAEAVAQLAAALCPEAHHHHVAQRHQDPVHLQEEAVHLAAAEVAHHQEVAEVAVADN